MKKIFLVTALTALPFVSLAKFETKLYGLVDNQFAYREAKDFYAKRSSLSQNNKNYTLNSNLRTGLRVTNSEHDNFKYGANIVFYSPLVESGRYDPAIQKTFLFVEGNLGRVELGTNYAATTMLSVSAADVAAATGGAADGDWTNYAPNPLLKNGGRPISFNPIGQAIGFLYRKDNDHESPKKITYFSPKFNGFQLGVSYIPDSSNASSIVGSQVDQELKNLKNVVSLALRYSGKISDFDTALSLGHDSGVDRIQPGRGAHYNLKDYNIGLLVGKSGVNFAASYGNAGKSLKMESSATNYKEYYYSWGVGYNQDKYNLSFTSLISKRGYNRLLAQAANYTKLRAYSFGADYLWFNGFKLYGEVTAYNITNPYIQQTVLSVLQSKAVLPANKGAVYIVGCKLQF